MFNDVLDNTLPADNPYRDVATNRIRFAHLIYYPVKNIATSYIYYAIVSGLVNSYYTNPSLIEFRKNFDKKFPKENTLPFISKHLSEPSLSLYFYFIGAGYFSGAITGLIQLTLEYFDKRPYYRHIMTGGVAGMIVASSYSFLRYNTFVNKSHK